MDYVGNRKTLRHPLTTSFWEKKPCPATIAFSYWRMGHRLVGGRRCWWDSWNIPLTKVSVASSVLRKSQFAAATTTWRQWGDHHRQQPVSPAEHGSVELAPCFSSQGIGGQEGCLEISCPFGNTSRKEEQLVYTVLPCIILPLPRMAGLGS